MKNKTHCVKLSRCSRREEREKGKDRETEKCDVSPLLGGRLLIRLTSHFFLGHLNVSLSCEIIDQTTTTKKQMGEKWTVRQRHTHIK